MEKKPVVINYYAGAEMDKFPWVQGELVNYELRFAVVQNCLDNNHSLTLVQEDNCIRAMIYKR